MDKAACPTQWQRAARTHQGIGYRIRPIGTEDAERERAFIMDLSEVSRYKRFMGSLREPPQALIDLFVHVDYHHDMAFVALVGQPGAEHITGIVRYSSHPDRADAEFAIAVADAWAIARDWFDTSAFAVRICARQRSYPSPRADFGNQPSHARSCPQAATRDPHRS